jgi:hypothetical protein
VVLFNVPAVRDVDGGGQEERLGTSAGHRARADAQPDRRGTEVVKLNHGGDIQLDGLVL